MMGDESLDFDLDSKGDLPKQIHHTISKLADNQTQFIIGHESAHHFLNHLNSGTTNIVAAAGPNDKNIQARFYGYSQLHELEADLAAVMKPNVSDKEHSELADATVSFFYGWIYTLMFQTTFHHLVEVIKVAQTQSIESWN